MVGAIALTAVGAFVISRATLRRRPVAVPAE
jgi:hypothetical protein